MIKKLAGVSLGAVLTASLLTGSVAASGQGGTPAGTAEDVLSAPQTVQTAQTLAEPENGNEMAAYLFVHFIGNEGEDEEQMYFSVSTDGTKWQTLNGEKPVLRSTLGEQGIRDPHIVRKQDGTGFYLIATDLSIYVRYLTPGSDPWSDCQEHGSQSIVVWESDGNSLTEWKEPRLEKIARDNAGCTWAPEAIWDKEQNAYMVFWASRTEEDGRQRVYRCYTEDFDTFTEPELYIEADDSRIDTTFYYDEESGVYYRFTKNEGTKKVYMERSTSLSGNFRAVATYRLNGQRFQDFAGTYEGPTVYKLNGQDKWCLLLDNYDYKPFETDDIARGEFTSAKDFDFNGLRFRHGTVIPITQNEYNDLMKKWGPDPADVDKTTGSLIYDLDFENGDLTAKTGSYTATASSAFTFVQGKEEGSKAAEFKDDKFITLSGDLLKGKDNVTLSFDVKITATNASSWLFFGAQNANQMNDPRTYYGVLFKDAKTFSAERYYQEGWSSQNDAYDDHCSNLDWYNVTIVYYKKSTKLFINGLPAAGVAERTASATLSTILGSDPTLYLGKATWGSGEFSTMLLDRFRVYDYAMPDEDVAGLTQSGSEELADGKLVYHLDFEENLTPTVGSKGATAHGTVGYIQRGKGKAVQFDKDTEGYLTLDGSVFAGLDSFTVSFAAMIPDKNTGHDGDKNVDWLFLVQKDDGGCAWRNEKYLSVLWEKGGNNIVAQRFNNTESDRPDVPHDTTHNTEIGTWVYITVVFGKTSTKLYLNGELKSTVASNVNIKDLLGSDPVAYLGYATWGSGEYSYAAVDNFRVYDGVISEQKIGELYVEDANSAL